MNYLNVIQGNSPIVLGFPHTGTIIDDAVAKNLNPRGLELTDTDWHVFELYQGLIEDASMVQCTAHRYVIDCNRDPNGESLYPGQNTTELCPTTDFDGHPIYLEGHEPSAEDIAQRIALIHKPYHDALDLALHRAHQKHGYAILFDCHSIRSEVPFLFEGVLPDLCLGTNDGATCDAELERLTVETCKNNPNYSTVLNGRFKGGWTTRHYGKPVEGYHAIQLELSQANYMQESAPWTYHEAQAQQLRNTLQQILTAMADWRPTNMQST